MSLSVQEYVLRLRTIYQQVDALTDSHGQEPIVSVQEWTNVLAYAFDVVPELEEHWREIGEWVASMTTLLDTYHLLAGQLLEEEDTTKLPASFVSEGQQCLLDYQNPM